MTALIQKSVVPGLIGIPLASALVLCALILVGVKLTERPVARMCRLVMWVHLCTVLGCLYLFASNHYNAVNINLGQWYLVRHYQFELRFLLDEISCPLLLTSSFLLNVIAYFCVQYLHRDKGYFRFCILYLFFAGGISLVISAGTVDLLFAGWEVLGLSSALLIGFYHERTGPAHNGLLAFVYYRFCDVALLAGAVLWHYYARTSQIPLAFSDVSTATHWQLSQAQFLLVSVVFIFASLAKSAQLPMSSWLPRAMEGPTPSSAIFYGALSIHAGAYLLLRLYPILSESSLACGLILGIGASTAIYGAVVARTRADVKNMLAYAALSQVGLIYVEIALGWQWLAIVHIVGHSLVRALQFLRSPTVLHDFHQIGFEPILGYHAHVERLFPARMRAWVYRQALVAEENLETIFRHLVIVPVLRVSSVCHKMDLKLGNSAEGPQWSEEQQ